MAFVMAFVNRVASRELGLHDLSLQTLVFTDTSKELGLHDLSLQIWFYWHWQGTWLAWSQPTDLVSTDTSRELGLHDLSPTQTWSLLTLAGNLACMISAYKFGLYWHWQGTWLAWSQPTDLVSTDTDRELGLHDLSPIQTWSCLTLAGNLACMISAYKLGRYWHWQGTWLARSQPTNLVVTDTRSCIASPLLCEQGR